MKLYIAEKHSVGAAIARCLGGPASAKASFIECPQSVTVTWLSGHLLRLAEPEEYDRARWKKWALETLPCVPAPFRKLPSDRTKQLERVVELVRRAALVVHAGDPDREGQMIVDEVLEFAGYKGPVRRILPNSTTPAAIAKALAEERNNGDYVGLRQAALGRQQADWLIGFNCTRAMTVASRHGHTLSVGRVKTPTLWLVVRRCREIEAFKPRQYYELAVDIRTASGAQLTLRREETNETSRLWDRAAAEELARAVRGATATLRVTETREAEAAPLPYRLRDFQMDANREQRWTAVKALEVLQKLYGGGLLTYPRTDIGHLRDEDGPRTPMLLKAIETGGLVHDFATFASTPGVPVISKRVFDSSKVKEHHGIITTDLAARQLAADEDRIAYVMVARRFLMSLMPPRVYERTAVKAVLGGAVFAAVGQRTTSQGWRLLKPLREAESHLPRVADGEGGEVVAVRVEQKTTVAPEHYTEASLLADMSAVHKYVDDPGLKARLKETSGIGTPATQATTIADLIENGYVERHAGRLIATQLGRDLIDNVPRLLADPGYTALMEEALQHVQEGRAELAAFTRSATQLTERLVSDIRERQGRMTFTPRDDTEGSGRPATRHVRRRKGTVPHGRRASQAAGREIGS
jgi:DNA topoisomerase-3